MPLFIAGLIAVILFTVAAVGVARILFAYIKLAWRIVRLPFRVAGFAIRAIWNAAGSFALVVAWGVRGRVA
jgi:hypothetical protein